MSNVGLNVSADGRHTGAWLDSMGARWARVVARRDIDLRAAIADYAFHHVRTLMVLDRLSIEAYGSIDTLGQLASTAQIAIADYAARYATQVAAWQPGNEPDNESESSWAMTREAFTMLGQVVRAYLPTSTIISGGLVSGQPSWLVGQDVGWADAIAIHPYLKDMTRLNDLDDIDTLVTAYAALGKPIAITEWGWWGDEARGAGEVDDVVAWAALTRDVVLVCYFCADDEMVAPFGLLRADGSEKRAAQAFRERARSQVAVPMPAPAPPVEPQQAMAADAASLLDLWWAVRDDVEYAPDSAIGRFWTSEPYRFGSPVGPERYDRDASNQVVRAVQAFTLARLSWTAGDAEAVAL